MAIRRAFAVAVASAILLPALVAPALAQSEGLTPFFVVDTLTPKTGETIRADASATRAEGAEIVEYAWRWTVEEEFVVGSRTATNNYTQAGLHVITLRVTDSEGRVGFVNQTILARGQTPTANFIIIENEELAFGRRVVVNATFSYAPGGADIVKYEWRWDRDEPFVEGNVTEEHLYSAPGSHVITLRVTDSMNRTDTVEEPVVVESTFLGRLYTMWDERDLFWNAALMTLYLAVISTVIGFAVAILAALLRISRMWFVRWPAAAYIEVVRGTPLFVQILIAWLVLPQMGLKLSIVQAGIVALVVNTSAYQAEAIRAGIQAIPTGQMEASVSLGMTYLQAMRHVILPQAFRLVIPPLGNEFIILLKDTSLVSVIGVIELTQAAQIFANRTFLVVEAFVGIAMIYFVMTYTLSIGLRALERRVAIPGLGLGGPT